MSPLKTVIATLLAALPECTLTDASAAVEVESQVRALITARDSFKRQVATLRSRLLPCSWRRCQAKFRLRRRACRPTIQAGIALLVTERDSFRQTLVNFPKSVVAALTAALPGKVSLTEASPIGDIENALKLLVGERDRLSIQVADLTASTARVTNEVRLLMGLCSRTVVWMLARSIRPRLVPPAPWLMLLNFRAVFVRQKAAPQAIAAVAAEFERAVEAERRDKVSENNPETISAPAGVTK